MKTCVTKRARRGSNNASTSAQEGDTAVQRKSVFGRYSDSEMLSQLKVLAMDPCKSRVSSDSIQPLWNQTLRVRKVAALGDAEFPRRKRILKQFLKEKFKNAPSMVSEIPDQQNGMNLSTRQSSGTSSASCLLNSVDSAESYSRKTLVNSYSSGSMLTFEEPSQMKRGISVESDGSNPTSPVNQQLDSVFSVHGSNTKPKRKNLQEPRRSIRLLNFIGDHLQRMTVPIGPGFQADVPDWSPPTTKKKNNRKNNDSETLRWLGTRVWPFKSRKMKKTTRKVGKGRPDSCSCLSPGSTDCIKKHISEEQLLLKRYLGRLFFSWKFDEMGEVVSKSWTKIEEQKFESIFKNYTQSKGNNLMKRASKSLPSKCRRKISSYYFNVFIPRRMSLQTRSSLKSFSSDDDMAEDDKDNRGDGLGSKGVRSRFLRLKS